MRYKLVMFLLIVAAILAACGGTTPTQEAQGGDGGGVELAESFSGATTGSGTLTLNYPAGYTQSGTADVLALTNADAGTGISITVLPSAMATTMGSSPAEILTAFSANMASAAGVTYGEPEEVTFGENAGALVAATANGVENVIAIVSVGDAYVIVGFAGPENASNRATLEAVASSIALGS